MGKAWHEAGRKTTKPNTWKDTIAIGEWLVRQGVPFHNGDEMRARFPDRPDVLENITEIRRAEMEAARAILKGEERFLDTYRRVGMEPFKEAVYG